MRQIDTEQPSARQDILDFSIRDVRYFYEPESGGIYRHHPLLREIFARVPHQDEAHVVRELSAGAAGYPKEEITALFKQLKDTKIFPLEPSKTAEDTGVTEMYLHVSHRCNLDCIYCYADGGSFGGPEQVMSETTARNAVDFLFRESRSHGAVIINFDGGEPLLNFPLVRFTVEYAKEKARETGKEVSFNISSNGTLFRPPEVNYLEENRVGIGISIDGGEAVHDVNRPFKSRRGSYRVLADVLEKNGLFHLRRPMHARATITKNALQCGRTVDHLYHMGFRVIYLEPAAGKDARWAIDRDDLEIIKEEFDRIADFYKSELLQGNIFILRNFYQPLQKIHRRTKSGYRCAAGRRITAVAPGGGRYPCYKFVGMPDYLMGNVNDEGLTGSPDRGGRRPPRRPHHVDRKTACKKCWARYLCGGGCAYLSELSYNQIVTPDELDCEFTRHLAKLALKLYAELRQTDKKLVENLLGANNARP